MNTLVGLSFVFAALMPLLSAQLLKLAEQSLPQVAGRPDAQQQMVGLRWAVDFQQVVAVSFLPVVTLLFAIPVSVASVVALSAEVLFAVVSIVLMLLDGAAEYEQRNWLGMTPVTCAGLVLNGGIGLAIIILFT